MLVGQILTLSLDRLTPVIFNGPSFYFSTCLNFVISRMSIFSSFSSLSITLLWILSRAYLVAFMSVLWLGVFLCVCARAHAWQGGGVFDISVQWLQDNSGS